MSESFPGFERISDGIEILKEIEFPWPIAKIILQHHEKLNGSGYPDGLRGDQILFPSRILTVADVMEAISRVPRLTASV